MGEVLVPVAEKDNLTAGEELFLAHLATNGVAADEENTDDTTPVSERKTRGVSIGEELWMVHCKRAQGVDLDADEETQSTPGKKSKVMTSSLVLTNDKVRTRRDDRVIHLRTRNVKIH